jgi:hypothetical protein
LLRADADIGAYFATAIAICARSSMISAWAPALVHRHPTCSHPRRFVKLIHGLKLGGRIVPPPTMPVFNLDGYSVELEAREAQARVIERRTIRRGRDAWEQINKAESFDGITRVNFQTGLNGTASTRWRSRCAQSPSSFTRTPKPSRHGGRHYRSDNESD